MSLGTCRLGAVGAFILVATACRPTPEAPVVGYALPGWGHQVVPLAEAALARRPAGPPIRFEIAPPPAPGDTVNAPPGSRNLRLVQRLAEVPGLVGVVGLGGSRESLIAAPVFREAGVVQLVPTGTSRLLTEVGPWTFPVPPDEVAEGRFIANYLVDRLGARRLAVFFVADEYGAGLRDAVEAAFEARRGEVLESTPVSGLPRRGASDPAIDLAAVVEAQLRRGIPDAVVVVGRPREALGITEALARLAPNIPVVASDGAYIRSEIVQRDASRYGQLRLVGFWHPTMPDSLSRRFVAAFRERYGADPDASHALTYDAFMVLATAVREVGASPRAVRDYLRSLGDSRPPFRGVTGPIGFGASRPGRFVMLRLVDHDVVLDAP